MALDILNSGVRYDVSILHKDYQKYSKQWKKCRDVAAGSEVIKEAGTAYLPMLSDQTWDAYENYKNRALFFGATGRTAAAMLGSLFAKTPRIAEEYAGFFDSLFPEKTWKEAIKNLGRELITVGRIGLLIDSNDQNQPYVAQYLVENIINWNYTKVNGVDVLRFVVLRETAETFEGFERKEQIIYRVCKLDEESGKYVQEIYNEKSVQSQSKRDVSFGLQERIEITRNGKPLYRIPFILFSVNGDESTIESPPILSLANVNISHFHTSADLEHGRHFTGLPTPWVAGFHREEGGSLTLGSSVAWVSNNTDARAGFLEFSGQGLVALENAIQEKEAQMAVLGSRLLEVPRNIAESADNQLVRRTGENSVLANIAESLSGDLTKLVNLAAKWIEEGRPNDEGIVHIESSPNLLPVDPGLIGALSGLHESQAISYDTLFENLKKMGIVREGVTMEQERQKILDDQFLSGMKEDE